LGPQSEWVKLGTSNFVCKLILTSTSPYMIEYPGSVQGHVTSDYWEITDNSSETVQDRDSYNGRLIGKN